MQAHYARRTARRVPTLGRRASARERDRPAFRGRSVSPGESLSLSLSGGKKIYVKPEDRARTRLTGRGLRHSRANNFHGPGREMFCPRSLSRPTNRQRGVRIVGVAVDRASRRRVRDSGRSFPLASGKRLKRSSQASSRTRRRGQ